LRGTYRAPAVRRMVGNISIAFASNTAATVTWPGGTLVIQRFDIVADGAQYGATDGDPETGWWWSATESGRGYFIETQGAGRALFVGGYMYDADGQAVWYISGGGLTQAGSIGAGMSHTGPFSEYANGQSMGGDWHPPTAIGSRGTVSFQFRNTREAILTLPDGRQVTLTRFVF